MAAYYAFLVLLGFFCLGRDWLAKPLEHSLHPVVVLDPWKIRGLDLILIPTFISLLVFGTSVITLEGYKLLLNTDNIADDHLYIFGFPMHLTILEAVMVWQIIKGGNVRFDFVEFANLFETP